jgi:hypothetical protein
MKAYKDFLKIANTPYNYNEQNKKLWGMRGIRLIKELAKELGAEAVNVSREPSGIIDRGDVSGFITKNNKFVYISISDSSVVKNLGEVLYRAAENEKDYTGKDNNFFKLGDKIEKLKSAVSYMLV